MENDVLSAIKSRRSVRSYQTKQIADSELQAIMEAATYAPDAGGVQPWHFTVIQNGEMLKRLDRAAKGAGRKLGGHLEALSNTEGFCCYYGAPTLVIVSGDSRTVAPVEDCSAATQNMLLAAESLGIGSCWIFFAVLAFHSPEGEALRQELKIPPKYDPLISVALGYKREPTPEAPARKRDLITYIR